MHCDVMLYTPSPAQVESTKIYTWLISQSNLVSQVTKEIKHKLPLILSQWAKTVSINNHTSTTVMFTVQNTDM